MSSTGGQRPRYMLARLGIPTPLFYVAGDPRATDSKKEAWWTPQVRQATTWDSKYAAKRAREIAGLSPDEVQVYHVDT